MSTSPLKLYTPEVLALATALAALPLDPSMPHRGSARSQSCGSTLSMSLATDGDRRITGIGLSAQACAIGQASAAIFAKAAPGHSRDEIAESLATIESWLRGEGDLPGWPSFAALAPVRDYPARHGALLLPWKAALDALPLDCPAS